MKKRLLVQLDKSSQQSENKGGIKFKQSNRRRKIIFLVKGLTIVGISAICGSIAGLYIINHNYQQNPQIGTIFRFNEGSADYSLRQSNVSKIVKSIVSISNSEDGFKQNLNINSTGIIIRSDGYILTSYNAISKLDPIVVKLPLTGMKSFFKAKLIGFDKITDVAVIKIQKDNLDVPIIGNTAALKVGDNVMGLGNYSGDEYLGFYSLGHINSLNKKIQVEGKNDADKTTYNVIQTDAEINDENTGGPLVNDYGELIGLNSKFISEVYSKQSYKYNYVIFINEVEDMVDSLINYGRVKRTTLGFDGVDLIVLEKQDIAGVYVQNIDPNGAAKKAGIRPLDIIISFDNKEIKGLDDIMNCMKSHKAGDKIKCKILSNGKKKEVTIVLEEAK